MYCHVINRPASDPNWERHRDAAGNPQGTLLGCFSGYVRSDGSEMVVWIPGSASSPGRAGTDPVTVARTAVASLQLHAPTVGVGAFVYDGYEEWSLSWWVGAPMWLWVDKSDPLQWGAHTISASDGGLTVTATVTAATVSFDPGDGSPPMVCRSAGTVRPWDPYDPLDHHSPSGCEHTYMHTNELGNINSRYVVSATVTWNVTWSSSDGQVGSFTTTVASTDQASIHVGQLRAVITSYG
ncbi:MAG: hypothetical protein LBI33_00840 [Propionibacteriaceae bacterium]|nr:hypothetical protein [Propionibacteriaceae bacterium]